MECGSPLYPHCALAFVLPVDRPPSPLVCPLLETPPLFQHDCALEHQFLSKYAEAQQEEEEHKRVQLKKQNEQINRQLIKEQMQEIKIITQREERQNKELQSESDIHIDRTEHGLKRPGSSSRLVPSGKEPRRGNEVENCTQLFSNVHVNTPTVGQKKRILTEEKQQFFGTLKEMGFVEHVALIAVQTHGISDTAVAFATAFQTFREMGYPENRLTRALLFCGETNEQRVLDYLSNFDTLLTKFRISDSQIEEIMNICNNSLELANIALEMHSFSFNIECIQKAFIAVDNPVSNKDQVLKWLCDNT